MDDLRMIPKRLRILEKIESSLRETEELLMVSNKVLGDILYDRYNDRMGFNKDGSYSRDGRVVWPERMVEDE